MADIKYLDITNKDIERYAKKIYNQVSDIYISQDNNQLLSLIKGAVNTFDGRIASIINQRNSNITNDDLIENLDNIIKYSEYYKNHLKGNNNYTYTDSIKYCINAQLMFFLSDINDLVFKNNRTIQEDSYDEIEICRNSVIKTSVELYSEIISDAIEQSNDFCIDECIRLYKKVLIAYLASIKDIIDGYCCDNVLTEFPITLSENFIKD